MELCGRLKNGKRFFFEDGAFYIDDFYYPEECYFDLTNPTPEEAQEISEMNLSV